MPKSQIIVISVVILLLIIGGAIFYFGRKPPITQKAEIVFWGVFDDSDVLRPLIGEFTKEYPNIQIKYYKKTYQTYEQDLLEAMAAGREPDIFFIHNTWLPKYQNKIYPAPAEIITLKEVTDSFVDVVIEDFVSQGYAWALPLSVDTLALYYNKDIFNTVGIAQPPSTWEEFIETVKKITMQDERGNIIRAGAALGTARNVNRSTDILGLLMIQSGAQMVDDRKSKATFDQSVQLAGKPYYAGQAALQFYTDFVNPLKSVYTWHTRMHYSIDAFYEGQAAMMFNYAYHIPTIRAKAAYLNFEAASMPQIKTSAIDVNYANYWGLTVSKNSKYINAAWQFIDWLTQREQAQKYLSAAQRPTARRDLVNWQKDDLDLGVFAQQALTARSWYQVDNSAIEIILADMVESVVLGEATVEQAVKKAADQVTLLMK